MHVRQVSIYSAAGLQKVSTRPAGTATDAHLRERPDDCETREHEERALRDVQHVGTELHTRTGWW